MTDQQLKTVVVWFRIIVGIVLVAVAVYMVLAGRVDLRDLVMIVSALLGLDRLVAAFQISKAQNGENEHK